MSIYKVGQQKRKNSKQVYVHKRVKKQREVLRAAEFA